jgi:Holliday junction resolvasome RuvABC DNA-binding subunit
MGYITVLIAIIVFLCVIFQKDEEECVAEIVIKDVKQPKPTKQKDPIKEQAQKQLVILGISATEAKQMLKDLECNSVEEYISESMKRVKI